jgi:hypothetical protein
MKLLKSALLASSLILSAGLVPMPAVAAGVSIDFGNVAIGYRDGYYDRDHKYHRWQHSDAQAYQAKYHENYRDMTHGRDHNKPWDH